MAPESDDNPWHYKISWNPRNIVLAGKAGATYKKNNNIEKLSYPELFDERRYVNIPAHDVLCWYPNRDSLSYIEIYGLKKCATFIRSTLRHPDFIYGWKNIIELKLTDEVTQYETNGKTLMDYFKEHMEKNNFSAWLTAKITAQFEYAKKMLNDLILLAENEKVNETDEFLMVNDKGHLQNVDTIKIKTGAASDIANRMHDSNLTLKQLFFLGMDDAETTIDKGVCTPSDVLQFALEKKLAMQPSDKDMVIMLHEIEYSLNDTDGREKKFKRTGYFTLQGENAGQTAMAKTVGLPLSIATKLILNGSINETGLLIPVLKNIYDPVLRELELNGIKFIEETESII